ncbi:MAG: CHAT domain-containing protein [Rubrivivax sp.]|nr:CHAT domain-containing protein [Rubrivivax sp.]
MQPLQAMGLARALKDAALQSWTQDPPRALRCAAAAAALAERHGESPVVQAMSDWTAAIAMLVEGRLEDTLARLDQACGLFEREGLALDGAQARVPKVIALAMLGRHDDALHCGEDARDRLLAAGDQLGAGKVEINLGTLLTRLDLHDQAARHYRSASVRGARVGNAVLSIQADIGLAQALTWQYQFAEALRVNERARQRAEARGLGPLQGQAQLAIGRIELLRGQWHTALAHLVQAVRQLEQVGAAPQQLMEASSALADTYLALNLLPEAVNLYDQVIAATHELELPTERARALIEKARAHGRLNHLVLARRCLQDARAIFLEAGNLAALADADVAEAALELSAGQAQTALPLALRASETLAALHMSGAHGQALSLVAQARLALGDHVQSRVDFEQLLDAGRTQGVLSLQLAACVGLGEWYWQQGRHEDAVVPLGEAMDLVERARDALPGDEFRSAIAALAERAHDVLVRATSAAAAPDPGAVLGAIERGRARALATALSAAADAPGQQVPEDEASAARLRLLRDRWRETVLQGEASGASAQAVALRAAEAAWLEAARRQALLGGAGAGMSRSPDGALNGEAALLMRTQQRLAADDALLSAHQDGDELTLVLVRREAVRVLRLKAPQLARAIESLRFQIDTPRYPAAGLHAHQKQLQQRVRRQAQEVYQHLLAAAEPDLVGVARLMVVPHRVLHYVPWSCLHDGRQWLIERMALTQLPSVQGWLSQVSVPWQTPGVVVALGAGGELLHHVREELQAVRGAFGTHAQVSVDFACDAASLRERAPAADVLHLACHGRFRADNPAFSALALADGPFTLNDVRALRLRASLVVLSACETGLSRVAPGDELIGLVRGFVLAGARRVLASQWAVDDASTAVWMRRFHSALASGHMPAQAVQMAHRQAIAEGEHPFRWAAMTLFGPG